MTVPDEEVFAFVDGELPPEDMARIEAAMATDPQLALRVETQRALRRLLSGAHAGVMGETPPERLTATAGGEAPKPVRPAEVIAFPGAKAKTKAKPPKPPRPGPREPIFNKNAGAMGRGLGVWLGLAACLAVGLFLGRAAMPPAATLTGADDPAPIAGGALAQALNERVSGQDQGPVRIGLTFQNQAGAYCRTFRADGQAPKAGVACREGRMWRVKAVVPASPAQTGDYRTAGSETPAAVLSTVDAMIAGAPLDAGAEARAKAAGWKAAKGAASRTD
ncbi:MAG: anti-sigma factor [Caulobacter sp.]|nr:anti-sigma factor [Caulobacter sp.]